MDSLTHAASKIFVDNLSYSDRIIEGVLVTVVGFLIVLLVLVILMLVVKTMTFFVTPRKKTELKESGPVASLNSEAAAKDCDIPEEELIAIFAAAIASSLNTSTYNLNIKSYKLADSNVPAWNLASRNDLTK